MKKVVLPSGAELIITMAPFPVARKLYMSIASELKGLKMDAQSEVDVNFLKDLLCSALESEKINLALLECMKRCTYNGIKITDDLFEPESARDDYLTICWEVLYENVYPFMKSLLQKYGAILQKATIQQQSK